MNGAAAADGTVAPCPLFGSPKQVEGTKNKSSLLTTSVVGSKFR